MPLFSPQRRDGNEHQVIEALRRVGAYVNQMDKSAGFDLLVAFRGTWFVMEVKNPGERLSDRERKMAVDALPAEYYIVHNADEALEAIGLL